ncbi:hypothetical protein STEG23_004927 [Scotinomys teguina]
MCRLSWFLDPGGWGKTAAVGLYFIFPGICTLSLIGCTASGAETQEKTSPEHQARTPGSLFGRNQNSDARSGGADKFALRSYVVQGQEPVCLRFQLDAPQIVECQIVCEVFKRFREPFNLISDSHYLVNVVCGLEISALIKDSSPVHIVFQHLCALIQDQENPIWVPERLTRVIRHEDPTPDPLDEPDSAPNKSRTEDEAMGRDKNLADSNAVEVDPKTFPIMTLLRERRDFGITAAIVAAIAVSAASAITAAVAMANQGKSRRGYGESAASNMADGVFRPPPDGGSDVCVATSAAGNRPRLLRHTAHAPG